MTNFSFFLLTENSSLSKWKSMPAKPCLRVPRVTQNCTLRRIPSFTGSSAFITTEIITLRWDHVKKEARTIIFRANLLIFPRRPESRELWSNWSDYLENWFRFIAPYCLPRTTMYIQRLGQKIPCSLDKSLYVVAVFMGNMLIRSRCHNLQMSFCLKIAILFCEGGKEGAKEGVTLLLCTATSSSWSIGWNGCKHLLKLLLGLPGHTGAHRGTQGVGGQLSF